MACTQIRRNQLLLLSLFVLFATATALQNDILHFNASTNRLYFRCPEEPILDGRVLFISLIKNDQLVIANWSNKDSVGKTMHERMRVLPSTKGRLLEAVMDHVTCHDVSKYTCSIIVDREGADTDFFNQTETFTYEGEVMDPVLSVRQHKARYNVGDEIELTCTARIGSASNSIVWETRLPDGAFQLVSGEKNSTVTEEIQTSLDRCSVRSTRSLTHVLTAEDDTREWRCRLNDTGQQAVYIVNVLCGSNKYCLEPCKPSPQPQSVSKKPTDAVALFSTNGKDSTNKEHDGKTELLQQSPHTVLILTAIICVLFVTIVICVVVMIIRLKKRTKKKLEPLVISPPPLDSNLYTSPMRENVNRILPPLPCENPYDLHDDDRRAVPEPAMPDDETLPKACSLTNSSVYISMSLIPSLHDSMNNLGLAEQPAKGSSKYPSLYSNQETIQREAFKSTNKNSAASHDSHVTMGNLKVDVDI